MEERRGVWTISGLLRHQRSGHPRSLGNVSGGMGIEQVALPANSCAPGSLMFERGSSGGARDMMAMGECCSVKVTAVIERGRFLLYVGEKAAGERSSASCVRCTSMSRHLHMVEA